ncbi:MAG TPA: hypothetical protein PK323_12935, partial [Bacteroidia bacterium]|nr:hypothetical protein [Bacteroidia bacterium]
MSTIKYPMGAADQQSKAYAAVIAATITNHLTALVIAQMTGAATLNLTVDAQMKVGAEVNIEVSADGTNRAFTPGSGMTGNAVTITASKNMLLCYYWNGTAF